MRSGVAIERQEGVTKRGTGSGGGGRRRERTRRDLDDGTGTKVEADHDFGDEFLSFLDFCPSLTAHRPPIPHRPPALLHYCNTLSGSARAIMID
jgi:hypothetical protein